MIITSVSTGVQIACCYLPAFIMFFNYFITLYTFLKLGNVGVQLHLEVLMGLLNTIILGVLKKKERGSLLKTCFKARTFFICRFKHDNLGQHWLPFILALSLVVNHCS